MNGASGWVRSGSVRDPRTAGLRPVQPAMALPGGPTQEVDLATRGQQRRRYASFAGGSSSGSERQPSLVANWLMLALRIREACPKSHRPTEFGLVF